MFSQMALFLKILTKQPHFVLHIKAGKLEVLAGKAPEAFVKGAREIVRDIQLESGTIMGFRKDRGMVFEFSSEISDWQQQRFRNLWQTL